MILHATTALQGTKEALSAVNICIAVIPLWHEVMEVINFLYKQLSFTVVAQILNQIFCLQRKFRTDYLMDWDLKRQLNGF